MFIEQAWKQALAAGLIVLLSSALSGCASTVGPRPIRTQTLMKGERPVVLGSGVRDNYTPMEAPLACLARGLTIARRRPLVIGVGDIKDYTGRYSINEGNAVTQGGALMLYSALAKLGGTVRIAERYDPAIAERELAYMDRRQLGNGEVHKVGDKDVPWLPYFGGTIQGSDYYMVGGITEVNANISSGGAEVAFNNIGGKRRTYTQSVAVDIRIVDSHSLLVVDSVSLQKQYTGYEVGANVFRFFGLDLFDINVGAKAQEPMQLGIRATIEEAAVRLVARVNQMDASPCLRLRGGRLPSSTSEQFFRAAASGKVPAIATAAIRSANGETGGVQTVANSAQRAPTVPARPNTQVVAVAPIPAAARPVPSGPAGELPAISSTFSAPRQSTPAPALATAPAWPAQATVAPRPPSAGTGGVATANRTAMRAPSAAPKISSQSVSGMQATTAGRSATAGANKVVSARPNLQTVAKSPVMAKAPASAPVMASATAKAPVITQAPVIAKAAARTAVPAIPSVNLMPVQTARVESTALNNATASAEANSGDIVVLTFEVGEVNIPGAAAAMLDRIVTLARKGGVTVALTTRDNETAFPAQRTRLLDSRIAVLLAALANRGIPNSAISVVWRPDSTDSTVYRQGAGLQALARIIIKS